MYLIAIGYAYVVFLMALASSSLLSGLFIAVFLGVLPLWIFIRLASRGRPRRSVGEDGDLTVPAHPALGEAGRGPDGEHAKPDQ